MTPQPRSEGEDEVTDSGECGAFSVATAGAFKRIHRSTCRYARQPYKWADQFDGDENALLVELMWTGAVNWHLGCRVCCPDLDGAMAEARAVQPARGGYRCSDCGGAGTVPLWPGEPSPLLAPCDTCNDPWDERRA